MSPERYQRVRAVYHDVCERPPAERDARLGEVCSDDRALLDEVRSLLRHHDAESGELADSQLGFGQQLLTSTDADGALDAAGDPHLAPSAVGRYRIIRRIGEGGMGTVYEAEQDQPVRRRVALKIIKPGMDTRHVVARFAQERQALALMDHPHIARVFDAGTTPAGLPFFAMELCTGESVTAYCDRNTLAIRDRLDLFVQVCAAVQHAHQKGLIHRDIKPSNVLVAQIDNRPHVKVIDFGIAKAVAERITDLTLVTEIRAFLGTPQYMSPEQAEGVRDVDTRADVYALGALLYELLTGSAPFSDRELSMASLSDVVRIIREVEPVCPSVRVRAAARTSSELAAARGVSPQRLPALLRGDLDWIVTKAIEKDRSRRYESAGALADDVMRYLAGDPVRAAPPSTAYRVQKFVRRHRGLVGGAALFATALIVGTAGTLWQASVARHEAKAARVAENDARRVAEFQAQMLEQIDPSSAGDELLANVRNQFKRSISRGTLPPEMQEARVADFEEQLRLLNPTDLAANLIDTTILKPAIDSVAQRFTDQPVVEAALNQTLATLYYTIGRYPEARTLQEKALATRMRVLGEAHADTLASMQALGYLMRLQGEHDGAEALLNETLSRCRQALGPDHPITLTTQSTCGGILRLKEQLPAAEACWRDVLERRRNTLGPDARDTITSINNMGLILLEQRKLDEAEGYFREALERGRRVLGPDHPTVLVTQNFLGGLLWRQNRFDEAESTYRETLEKRVRLLGELHPRAINTLANLGELLLAAGNAASAEPILREAWEKRRKVLGEKHSLTLKSAEHLATCLEQQGRRAEAQAVTGTPSP